jgi:hypothetical protein
LFFAAEAAVFMDAGGDAAALGAGEDDFFAAG